MGFDGTQECRFRKTVENPCKAGRGRCKAYEPPLKFVLASVSQVTDLFLPHKHKTGLVRAVRQGYCGHEG
jgi:hypothetical protein